MERIFSERASSSLRAARTVQAKGAGALALFTLCILHVTGHHTAHRTGLAIVIKPILYHYYYVD